MAADIDPGNYREFSVVLRPRPGIPCSLSTNGIITQISEHLAPYKCICNIAFSSNNFVLRLPTLELQLEILSRKTFAGSNYVLDIVPWCSEYESFDLPWIFISSTECIEIHKAAENSCTNNLTMQLQSQIHNVTIESHDHQLISPEQGNLVGSLKKVWIWIPQPQQYSEIPIDFSYLMIIELKDFYHAKVEVFHKLKQICKEMHSIALQFYDQVEKIIGKIYKETSEFNHRSPEDALYHVARFGDYLHDKLWFLSEETFGLQFSNKPIYQQDCEPIDISHFTARQTNSQVKTPIVAASLLKIIAESAIHQIYNSQMLIGTEVNFAGDLDTQIWCNKFHHTYRTSMPATVNEAEANTIYRFLKYASNVLGYIIGDPNSHVLLAMISHINSVNASLADLHLHTKRVVQIIKQVDEGISKMYSQIAVPISSEHNVYIKHLIDDLLALLQHYKATTIQGLHTFEQQKETFWSIKFQTAYRSKPDYT